MEAMVENITMEDENTNLYSSPYENYLRVLETIQTLETNTRLTEDWYEEHKQHILKYRDYFSNFGTINQEVEDREFRTKARDIEVILSSLVHEVKSRKLFNVKTYLILNKLLKEIVEFLWSEEDLASMIEKMSM